MEAKTILRLIKNDIAHLEEITSEFSLESPPSSDEVELCLVRAKTLLRELELLQKFAALHENGLKMINPVVVPPVYHSEHEPFELFESDNGDNEPEVKKEVEPVVEKEGEPVVEKEVEPEVEMIPDQEDITLVEEVQQIELHLDEQKYIEQIPEVEIPILQSEEPIDITAEIQIDTEEEVEEQIMEIDEPAESIEPVPVIPFESEVIAIDVEAEVEANLESDLGSDVEAVVVVLPEPIEFIAEIPTFEETTIEEPSIVTDIPEQKEEIIAEEFSEVKKTLNETLGDSHQMVNDILSPEKGETGFQIIPIHSIWDGIGINDRFLFIRELFANSSAKFETTIYALDKLDTIHDAVNYLKMNFKWNKTEASQKFLVLVKRRFTK